MNNGEGEKSEAAPRLGELARQRRRGRQSSDTSRGEKKEQGKEKSVIAPKGTRRQINESWYAAVARSGATWQSVPLYATLKHTADPKEKRIPTASDVGH